MFDRTCENVRGFVIGDMTITFAVCTPDGKEYGNRRSFPTIEEGKTWAKSVIDKARKDVGEQETRYLGWDKPWEMRIYE